ncbi:MAG: DUF951 domain-containing protein [Armatimonadota bacterium]|nr:DUF951 domain-containing protein [Armatimonadota bacterium]
MPAPYVKLYVGDVIRTRKAHPCGGDVWVIERLGADVGIRCRTCGRFVLMDRIKLERRIRAFLRRGNEPVPEPEPPPPPEAAKPRGRRPAQPSPEPRPRRRIVKRARA